MVLQSAIGCLDRVMKQQDRDTVKGELLLLWLEDLRCDREPRICPEMQSLAPDEIREVMSLARFLKAAEWQSEVSVDLDKYARTISERVLLRNVCEAQHTAQLIQSSPEFPDMLREAINSLSIDRRGLQESLALPRHTLSDLESGRMPPHRLPLDTMLKLLRAVRADTKDVVSLIRRSALRWANSTYQRGQVQLGRVDLSLSDDTRVRVMRDDNGVLAQEVARIHKYCDDLAAKLGR